MSILICDNVSVAYGADVILEKINFSVNAGDKVGVIGVKVWICRGEVYGKRDLAPSFTSNGKEGRGAGNGSRRGGFRNNKKNR